MAASRLENLKDLKREWKDYSDDAEFSENRYFHHGSDCLKSSKMREERAQRCRKIVETWPRLKKRIAREFLKIERREEKKQEVLFGEMDEALHDQTR